MNQISVLNLNSSSPQHVFDYVSEHLLRQNQQCAGEFSCLYKNGELRCAAGFLIPDELYEREFEGKSWASIAELFGVKHHKELILALQMMHDNIPVCDWEGRLGVIAEEFGLEFTPLACSSSTC